ncbi:hypothetical protein BGZ94_008183 [Podila epigama]|nr:hypothetical protein BGZ94_008183 [Podila epigama]
MKSLFLTTTIVALATLAQANTPLSLPQTTPVDVTLFVMSRCPDAIQCEATFARVYESPDLAPVKPVLSYIGTTDGTTVTCKHGALECAGNTQQLCFQKYHPDHRVWVPFVIGMNSWQPRRIGELNYVREVAKRIGGEAADSGLLDAIEKCAQGPEGRQLLIQSIQNTKDHNVGTSCTVFIDNKKRCVIDGGIWRECPGGFRVRDFVRSINSVAGKITSSLRASITIKAIDKESVHRICSGQVVLDMATAVKELLENSLDSGATSIVVKFKQNGLEYITVTDNGCGITDENLESLALKHYTSKLSSFSDLAMVRSFGFRGEALSSLCALANLTVTTSTGAYPMGVLVEYTSEGTIQSKSPVPMTKGTIVKISDLFEGMPVRRSEFVKNIKREYTKCIALIQAYALIATNVRISCVSQVDKKPVVTYVATSGNNSVRQNIINVFGIKAMTDVIDFRLELVKADPSSAKNGNENKDEKAGEGEEEEEEEKEESGDIILTGYISSPSFGKGRSSTDRQYLFINGRPCVLPKIARVVNEVYHSFNTNQSPFLVADLIMPTSFYDVNVSPDKRTIFLHNERMLVEEIRNKLTELFEPSRSTFTVSEARQLIKKPDLSTRITSIHNSSLSRAKEKVSNGVSDEEMASRNEDDDGIANQSFSSTLLGPVSTMSLSSKSSNGDASTPTVKNSHGPDVQSSTHSSTKAAQPLQQPSILSHVRKTLPSENLKRKKTRSAFSDSEEEEVVEQKLTTRKSPANTPPDSIVHVDDDSTAAMDVLEGYDPLDDRARKQDDPVSESDEGETMSYPSPPKVQRVVVLDSDIEYDNMANRNSIEIGVDMQALRRKRELRMKVLKETRRVEQDRAELRRKLSAQKEAQDQSRAQAAQLTDGDIETAEEEEVVEENEEEVENGDEREGISDEEYSLVKKRASGRQSRTKQKKMLSDASFANTNDAQARKSLSRVISKGDFARMKILGQFNKAFIVARLDKYASPDPAIDGDTTHDNEGDTSKEDPAKRRRRRRRCQQQQLVSSDIFVIDQHASDEKYNFEILQAKTVFSTQKLFQPKSLYLTAQEELVVVDHMKTLNKNGFYLDYDPEAAVSHRLKLVTLPVSERVVFDLQDFEELVFLLSQQTVSSGGGDDEQAVDGDESHKHDHSLQRQSQGEARMNLSEKVVRCSKVRNLFASRACRRSVMIGHVLNHGQMKRIVRHMGEIDQPWNCPHGRPTMRHLLDLAQMERQERKERLRMSEGVLEGEEMNELLLSSRTIDWTGAFDPIALKRPTRHQGTFFKQFIADTPNMST